MADVKFFVEGKRDSRFLTDYTFHLFRKKFIENNFVKIDGCTIELAQKRTELYQENSIKGGINLMIFDANGNFGEKQRELLSWKAKLNIEFELFLFPNDSTPGNLETLLENISLPKHRNIFDCFDRYQECISANPDYTLPNNKAKIYAYLEAILSKSRSEEIREDKRSYLDPSLWNLSSPYLNPLKAFLEGFIL